MNSMKESYIKVSLQEMDWYIVFSYIKKQSTDIADAIDKLNAQSKMLKNSSFGALIFSVIFLAEFLISGYSLNNLLSSIACLIVAITLAKEFVKFLTWFYQSIYQSYVGIIAEPDFLPVKLTSKSKATPKRERGCSQCCPPMSSSCKHGLSLPATRSAVEIGRKEIGLYCAQRVARSCSQAEYMPAITHTVERFHTTKVISGVVHEKNYCSNFYYT